MCPGPTAKNTGRGAVFLASGVAELKRVPTQGVQLLTSMIFAQENTLAFFPLNL